MFDRIVNTFRRAAGWTRPRPCRLVVDMEPCPESNPVLGVDFSGSHSSVSRADALLTLIEPRSVLDAAELLSCSGQAPDAWLVVGIFELPFSTPETADFLVELCRVAKTDVYVSTDACEHTRSTRLVAHLRRSAAKARRRRLSPTVRVLSSGRGANMQAENSESIATSAPLAPHTST